MMYDKDDILIVGDSFAQCRANQIDWPVVLARKLTNIQVGERPRGEGFGGSAWWSVRNQLLRDLAFKVPKILVICHTEPTRLPSDSDLPLNVGVESGGKYIHYDNGNSKVLTVEPTVAKAATLYYKYLMSVPYVLWAQAAWFRELDELCETLAIPIVIHMHCFPGYGLHREIHIFKHGVTIEEDLRQVQEYSEKIEKVEHPQNHFNTQINIKMAEFLYSLIVNFDENKNGKLHRLGIMDI